MPPSKKKKKNEIPVTPEPVKVESISVKVEPEIPNLQILDYSKEFETLSESLKNALSLVKDLTTQVNKLQKQIAKDKKGVDKELKKKNKTKKTDRVLNGFSKPGPVSAELKKFFDLDKDEKIARTEVTKKITAYCVKHKLQNEKDKRIIKPNKELKKLLRLKDKDELTYFNLQKYMKIHFPNKDGVYIHT